MNVQSLITTLSKDTIEELAEQNKDYAQIHGIGMRLVEQRDRSDIAQILPTTLVPSKVPANLFKQAYEVQKDLCLLYHKVAFDYEFIKQTLIKVIETDQFTKCLFDIYTKVYQENNHKTQPIVLTILRSDYMFHRNVDQSYVLRQVEVNTIAAGGAGLGKNVTNMHKHMIRQGIYSTKDQADRIPDNRALLNVASGLAEAYRARGNSEGIILVVIENFNQNIMDQRLVEYETSKLLDWNVVIRRLTLTQCYDKLHLDEKDGCKLMTDDGLEVSVVYFRSGYHPCHYPTNHEWKARFMIEKSLAIKCPWIGAHLAGTKKVQQVLSNVNILKRFLQDDQSVKRIIDVCAEIYGLDMDDPKTDKVLEKVLEKPENYVLKPQLEGGGNNIYDGAIAETLKKLSPIEREAYILMERLRPLVQENILVRANEPLKLINVDNELGIFGYLLGSKDNIIKQEQFGHMIRTKPSTANEGGISTGAAGHDSPFLF